MKASLLFLLILVCHQPGQAQFSVGIAVGGIGYHPREDKNVEYYRWKIDRSGKLAGYAGVTFFATYRLNSYLGIKVLQSIVPRDCAGKFAGITHLGVNVYDDVIGWNSARHEFSLSFGPFWYYRKNWRQLEGYANDPDFIKMNADQNWERKFVWHGGQIEYLYRWKDHASLAVNILPGYPYFYTAGMGGSLHVGR
jgi:hypothetical protein